MRVAGPERPCPAPYCASALGAEVVMSQDIMGIVLSTLPVNVLANCAQTCRALHTCAQVPLVKLCLEANVQPPRLGDLARATALTIATPHDGMREAARKLKALLPELRALSSLVVNLQAYREKDVSDLVTACKTLSSLTHLGLHKGHLCTIGAHAVARTLPCLPHLQSLSLSGSQLRDVGFAALQAALLALPTLAALDLSDSGLTHASVPALMQVFLAAPHLRHISLHGNSLAQQADHAAALAAVSTNVPALRSLLLGQTGLSAFAAVGPLLPGRSSLQALDLSSTGAVAFGLPFFEALAQHGGLTRLGMGGARVAGEQVVAAMAVALEALPGLREVVLPVLPMTWSGVSALVPVLQGLTCLTALQSDCTPVEQGLPLPPTRFTAQQTALLCSLLSAPRHLRSLRFRVATIQVIPAIARLTGLTRLHLTMAGFSGAPCELPSSGALQLRGLRELELFEVYRSAEGQSQVAMAIEALAPPSLTRLVLETASMLPYCRPTPPSSAPVAPPTTSPSSAPAAPSISRLTALHELNIRIFNHHADELSALAYALTDLTALTALTVAGYFPADTTQPWEAVAYGVAPLTRLRDLRLTGLCFMSGALDLLAAGLVRLGALTALHVDCIRETDWAGGRAGPPFEGLRPPRLQPPPTASGATAGPLFGAALARLRNLQVLQFREVDLGSDFSALASLSRLRILGVVGVDLSAQQGCALGLALRRLPQLASLTLMDTQLAGGLAGELADGVQGLVGLTRLSLAMARLRARDAKPLAHALAQLTQLQVLDLAGNPIGAFGVAMLVDSMLGLTRLVHLNMSHTAVGLGPPGVYDDAIKKLKSSLPNWLTIWPPDRS